ncbi:hypothetical protein F5B22DRAFT_641408 [Xylaria bambusicola]|uniref:uncharacterized protein n=1 Tax=Xylaria bambusicola TaxID=326684 RepID=UPI00200799F1|nr:uncharacterized protein F5B22DRAFT_641408 [Xylaria bambusicola]KAI0526257.1 hypothetical protein F5B22DRAFT_641408 [Xylaria bambusicola]
MPKPVASEAEVPSHVTGHDNPDSPDNRTQEPEMKVQHDIRDGAAAQSPSPTAAEKSTDDLATSEADDSEVPSEATGNAPADSPKEVVTETSSAPPLPKEPLPDESAQDDGWDCHWDPTQQAWYFHNHITNEYTWENPRVPSGQQASTEANTQLQTPPATAVPPLNERPPAGGYNPAIHGDYDPNAWYARNNEEDADHDAPVMDTATAYAAIGSFNRFTGRWQSDEQNPERHNDEAKSRRQMNAFFDVDAAANAHDGRSLKAERSGKKPSKSELKHFKEKRRAKKEEKRRAWLRD